MTEAESTSAGAILEEKAIEIDDIWIFGYGSLIWKTDFPFVQKKTGYIKGFVRRFYQNSIDHRGTKENPGRVVTLIPSNDEDAKVWGMAYKIAAQDCDAVFKYLDFREINGYSRCQIKFHSCDETDSKVELEPLDIIVYMADKNNESYAGESALEALVQQIANATGKSGPNREYVYNLANSMRTHYPNESDEHLYELETKLKQHDENIMPVQS